MLFSAQNWYDACSKREQSMLDREMDLEERVHELRHYLDSAEQADLDIQLQDARCSDYALTQYRKEQVLDFWEEKITAVC